MTEEESNKTNEHTSLETENKLEIRQTAPRMMDHVCSDGFKYEYGAWAEDPVLQRDLMEYMREYMREIREARGRRGL